MRILIIEDNGTKANDVAALLRSEMASKGEGLGNVDLSSNLSDAVKKISTVKYDLIVLDLMLPFLEDGLAETNAGLELLKQLRKSDSFNRDAFLVGLSAFPDELTIARHQFEAAGVLILEYQPNGTWGLALSAIVDDISKRADADRLDFVIFVALQEEKAGFFDTGLSWGTTTTVNGLNAQFATLNDRNLKGAIVQLRQMGLVSAVLDTALAIMAFRPNVVCMSGICAGFSSEAALGQLVVASPAWEYQAGKWSNAGFEIAPYQIPLRPKTRVLVDQALEMQGFLDSLELGLPPGHNRPAKRMAPIVAPATTGSAVIASEERLRHIAAQHRKVAALDMETFGLYYAAHESLSDIAHFFSVKCVVDLADKEKSDDLHFYGCAVSARAAVHLISSIYAADD